MSRRKGRLGVLLATGLLALVGALGLSTSAAGHDRACPPGWSQGFVLPGAFHDNNENGRICFKVVNGEGNAAGEGVPGFNTKDDHVHN